MKEKGQKARIRNTGNAWPGLCVMRVMSFKSFYQKFFSVGRERGVTMRYMKKAILLFMVLHSLTVYAKDINLDLLKAAGKGDTTVIKKLLVMNANVDAKGYNGRTALMLSASHDHIYTVKALLKKGARIDAKDYDGWTALMYAAFNGYTSIV